jgi:hypothetical protein
MMLAVVLVRHDVDVRAATDSLMIERRAVRQAMREGDETCNERAALAMVNESCLARGESDCCYYGR